jgi:YggT family protein
MEVFIFQFFSILLTVLSWAILIRVLLSWIPNLDRGNPLVQLLAQITDPVLEPARRIIPPIGGMDLSPIVVLLLLRLLQQVLTSIR